MTRSARRRHQYAVDLPGYVALETADDLPLALALRGAPRALCSDIGPLHLLSSGEGRVGHSEPHGAMLDRSHRGSGPISLTTALVVGPGIESLADAVAKEVEAEDGEEDRHPREEGHPPGRREVGLGLEEHRAPARFPWLGPETEVR